jgi:hypothetical protein
MAEPPSETVLGGITSRTLDFVGAASRNRGIPSAEDDAAAATELREARIAVWRWYAEWSDIAKAVIKRRDWLIQLGLAQRKTTKKPQ